MNLGSSTLEGQGDEVAVGPHLQGDDGFTKDLAEPEEVSGPPMRVATEIDDKDPATLQASVGIRVELSAIELWGNAAAVTRIGQDHILAG